MKTTCFTFCYCSLSFVKSNLGELQRLPHECVEHQCNVPFKREAIDYMLKITVENEDSSVEAKRTQKLLNFDRHRLVNGPHFHMCDGCDLFIELDAKEVIHAKHHIKVRTNFQEMKIIFWNVS